MDYKSIIKNKHSVRNFNGKEISHASLQELKTKIAALHGLSDNIETEIVFKNNNALYQELSGYAGYNGVMVNAPHYIVLLSEKKEFYLENSGYLGEAICLTAFDMGIDSCWITFKSSDTVKERLNLRTSKEVSGLLALGYHKKVLPGFSGKVKTGGNYSNADIRLKREISDSDVAIEDIVYIDTWGNTTTTGDLKARGIYDAVLSAALSPSTLNRQPWRFIIDREKIILTVRQEKTVNPYEEAIDAGIVMLYFQSVISQTLFSLQWNLEPVENRYRIPEDYKIIASCRI